MNTYLTTEELSARIKYDVRTIRQCLKDAVLFEGVHYIRPFGGRKILYLWGLTSIVGVVGLYLYLPAPTGLGLLNMWVALPLIVVLRYRAQGERRVRSICVPRDAQAADVHRRLRVRLKFSRRRWAAPG